MQLPANQRRALIAAGHHLKAALTVSADHIEDSVVAHVRQAMTRHPLLKVRIAADRGSDCDAAAATLAERVPCALVQRVGRVALLYRPAPEDAPSDTD